MNAFLKSALGLLLIFHDSTFAQQTPESEAARLRALLDKAPTFLEFLSDNSSTVPFTPVAVHRWVNNERDPHGQGVLVLWTSKGCPQVAASLYPWNDSLVFEMESLTRGTFLCTQDGVAVWRPVRGQSFPVIPGAETPADSPTARLRQMKALADEFSVTMLGWKADDSDREELRRLPKEFFRYKPENEQVIDGAVFGFVKGTDPEALLIIEAVKVAERSRYEYAFVRQTSGALSARHKGQQVWSAEKHPFRGNPSQPFFSAKVPLDEAYSRIEK